MEDHVINNKLYFIRKIYYFIIFISVSIATYAADDGYEIEISSPRYNLSLVPKTGENEGKIYKKYISEFIELIHGNTKKWETLISTIETNNDKGVAGEIASVILFNKLGYKILEEHFINVCSSKIGSNNGIDGIFILKDENFLKPSHVIINESKFKSSSDFSKNIFDIYVIDKKYVRQSHSSWNKDRFKKINCTDFKFNYEDNKVIRTATQLDENGNITLYEIKDAKSDTIAGKFASEAPKDSLNKKKWDKYIIQKK